MHLPRLIILGAAGLLAGCGILVPGAGNVENTVRDELDSIPPIEPGDSCFLDSGTLEFDYSKAHSFVFASVGESSSGGLGPNYHISNITLNSSLDGDSIRVKYKGASQAWAHPKPPASYARGEEDSASSRYSDVNLITTRVYPVKSNASRGLFLTREGRKVLVVGVPNEQRIYMEPYGLIHVVVNRSQPMNSDYRERYLRVFDGDSLDTWAVFGAVKGLIRKYRQLHPGDDSFYWAWRNGPQ